MRIRSKFHDYYDTVLMHGHDDRVVYDRDGKVLFQTLSGMRYDETYKLNREKYSKYVSKIKISCDASYTSLNFSVVTVFFCGKLYRGVQVTHGWNTTTCYYSEDSLMEFLNSIFDSIDLKVKISSHSGYDRYDGRYNERKIQLSDVFKDNGSETSRETLVEKKIVTMVVTEDCYRGHVLITQDTPLNDIQFYRVVDPYTAFQEIDMFLSGIAAPENNAMVEIEDKYKISEHGFDKFSFRKQPTKKR